MGREKNLYLESFPVFMYNRVMEVKMIKENCGFKLIYNKDVEEFSTDVFNEINVR